VKLDPATVIYGAGYYRVSDDLAFAAFLEGLVALGTDTATTVYVHVMGTKTGWDPVTTLGLSTQYYAGTETAVWLSSSITAPTLPVTVVPIKITYSDHSLPQPCYGVGPFKAGSDVKTCAVVAGMIGPGETKTFYLHAVPTQRTWLRGSNYGYSTSDATSVSTGFMLRTTSTPPTLPLPDGPWPITITLSGIPTGTLVGTSIYTVDSCVVTAAYHMGLISVGVPGTFYVHKLAAYPRFYSSTLRGVKSQASKDTAEAFVVTNSATSPSGLSDTMIQVTLTADQHPDLYTSVYGAGYFQYNSDITGAAIKSGMLRPGQTVTLWVHYIGMWNRWYRGQLTATTASTADEEGFALDMTNTPPTVTPDVTPMTVTASAASSAACYGVNVYRYDCPVDSAVVHAGLLSWGQSGTIYVHHIASHNRFYAASSGGMATLSSFASSPAYVLSASATPPSGSDLPTATVTPVKIMYTFAETFAGTLYGTGRYEKSGDVSAMAYHAGLFDETTSMPFTFYVHSIGVGGPIFGSRFNGVASGSSWSTSIDMVIVSSATTAPPSCMTASDSVYAVVQGRKDTTIYVDSAPGVEYQYQSDVATAAVYSGIVVAGQSKVMRITKAAATTPATYTVKTANGITSAALTTSNDFAFTLTDDQSCSFPFPAVVAAPPATTCNGACDAAAGFVAGSTADGTMFQVVLRGLHSTGTAYGYTYYPMSQDWQVSAVHAGAVKVGETKTVYVFYVGARQAFYGGWSNGVLTSGTTYSTAQGSVYFSAVNVAPTLTPDLVPLTVKMGKIETTTGTGFYTVDNAPVNVAAFHEGLATVGAATTVYLHEYTAPGSALSFYGARQWNTGKTSAASANVRSYKLSSSATRPAAPSVTSNEITLRCSWFYSAESVVGASYHPYDQDLCQAAFHQGWFAGAEVTKTVWVHNIGSWPRFFAGTGAFTTATYSATAAQAMFLSTSATPPTVTSNVLPVTLTAAYSLKHAGTLAGVPRSYLISSDVKAAAVHSGLLTDGGTWSGFVHFGIGSKNAIHSMLGANHIVSDKALSTGGPYLIFALSTSSTNIGSDGFTADVTALTLPASFPTKISGSNGYGFNPIYAIDSDVRFAATHAGLITPAGGATVYAHRLAPMTCYAGGSNNGVFTSTLSASASDAFVLSTSSSSYDTAAVATGSQGHKAKITMLSPFGGPPSYGFGRYEVNSNVAAMAWHQGLATSIGTTATFYVHFDRTNTARLFTSWNNGLAFASAANVWTTWLSVSQDPNTANSDPQVTKDAQYIFRNLKVPNVGWHYFNGDSVGVGHYHYSTRVTAAAVHYGLLARKDSTVKDVYLFYRASLPYFTAATMRGVYSGYSLSPAGGFTVATTATNPYISDTKVKVDLQCNSHSAGVWGTVIYTAASDVCRVANHEGLLSFADHKASASPTTVYLHYRTHDTFLRAYRHGWVSTEFSGATNYPAYLLSTSSTAPAIDIQHFKVSNVLLGRNQAFPACFGATAFREDSEIGMAAYLSNLGAHLTTMDVWVHAEGEQVYFPSKSFGSIGSSPAPGGPFSFQLAATNTAPPTTNKGNAFQTWVWYAQRRGYYVYGLGTVQTYSDLTKAAFISGVVDYLQLKQIWVYTGTFNRFYRGKRGAAISYSWYTAAPGELGYFLSNDAGGMPAAITAVRTYANITVQEYAWRTVFGTGTYRVDTLIPDAALHSNWMQLGQFNPMYIHDVGTITDFYGSTNLAVTSYHAANANGFTLTTAPAPPSALSPSVVKVDVTVDVTPSGTLIGTGVYTMGSSVTLAAFHSGLMGIGERRTLYLHKVGARNRFYRSERNGILSQFSNATANGFMLWYRENLPSCMITPTHHVFRVFAPISFDASSPVYGGQGSDYERESYVDHAAVHAGIAPRGSQVQVKLAYVSTASYPALVQNGVRSDSQADNDGFHLSIAAVNCGVMTKTRSLTKTITPVATPAPPTPAPTAAPPVTTASPVTPAPTTVSPPLTPAPPTPAPTPAPPTNPPRTATVSRSLPLPTPVPPPPPPMATLTASLQQGTAGTSLVRRGDVLTARIAASYLYLSAKNATSTMLVVTLTLSSGLQVPTCGDVPPQCRFIATGTMECRVGYFNTSLRAFEIPLLLSFTAAAPIRIDATVTLEGWNGTVQSDLYADPPTATATATLATVLDAGLTAEASMRITAVVPPMNTLSYGAVISITGTNLQLLPSMLPIGPMLLLHHSRCQRHFSNDRHSTAQRCLAQAVSSSEPHDADGFDGMDCDVGRGARYTGVAGAATTLLPVRSAEPSEPGEDRHGAR
jgi:hypothetical protein